MKNLLTRSATGIVFVSVILASLLIGRYTYLILFTTIIFAGILEYLRLFNGHPISPGKIITILSGCLIFLISYLSLSGVLDKKYLFLSILPIFLICISELYRKSSNPVQNISVSVLGVLYISGPLSISNFLVFSERGFYLPAKLIAIFIIVWLYDSFAYIMGKLLGKNRLFERISPQKSWEGAILGAIITLVSTYFLAGTVPGFDSTKWLILALLIVVFSTFGDLTQSLIKRQFGLKDSSNLLPGHGGILDRIDSILFAIPIAVLFIMLMN